RRPGPCRPGPVAPAGTVDHLHRRIRPHARPAGLPGRGLLRRPAGDLRAPDRPGLVPQAGANRMSQAAPKPYNVLFLCTGNSCRSIMAEAIMNRAGGGRFVAHSAGSHPTGVVNPHASALLQRMNHPTEHLWSKPWDVFTRSKNPDAPELDFV